MVEEKTEKTASRKVRKKKIEKTSIKEKKKVGIKLE